MSRVNFTVLGASGFIGRELVQALKVRGSSVFAPTRNKCGLLDIEALRECELGHVFYCIGLTADFRQRPLDTIEAHVCLLQKFLQNCHFDSFTYLSSTRVYQGAASTCELEELLVKPLDPDHLYNLSKLAGESLCLHSGHNNIRIVRLSNVYGVNGSNNFLSNVLREAAKTGRVTFHSTPTSAKDYVALEDVVNCLPDIGTLGKQRIYNLASGRNVSNAEIVKVLEESGVQVKFARDAKEWKFPPIDIARFVNEFGGPQYDFIDNLPKLIQFYL